MPGLFGWLAWPAPHSDVQASFVTAQSHHACGPRCWIQVISFGGRCFTYWALSHPQMCFFFMLKTYLSFLECFPKSCPKQLFFKLWSPFLESSGTCRSRLVFCILFFFFVFKPSISLKHPWFKCPWFHRNTAPLSGFPFGPHFCDTGWRLFIPNLQDLKWVSSWVV